MRGPIECPPETPSILQHYDIKGFKSGLQSGLHYADRATDAMLAGLGLHIVIAVLLLELFEKFLIYSFIKSCIILLFSNIVY